MNQGDVSYHEENEAGKLTPSASFSIQQEPYCKQLKIILMNAGLEDKEYLEEFKANNISDINLYNLQLDDIETVFAKYNTIVKKGFYNSLVLWKRDNPLKAIEAPSLEFHKYKDKKHLINIESILKNDLSGQKAIKHFESKKKLDDAHRTLIITVVINYIINSNIWVKKSEFEDLTNKILNFFKTNDPDKERVRCFILMLFIRYTIYIFYQYKY